MAAKSISETKRVRYLLGLSSPAEREHIESEYFEDEDAFQEMLTAEDDLIDAYARGELTGEERRRFEVSFVSSLHGRDRVQFARAFAGTVFATQSVETKLPGTWLDIFTTFRSSGLLRTTAIAVAIVFVAVLAWLVVDGRKLTNELRELRAESAQLSKRTEALQRSSETERTRSGGIAVQRAERRAQPDTPSHREHRTTATQRARHLPEVKNVHEKLASSTPQQAELLNTQTASLGNAFEAKKITQLPLNANDVPGLLSLQPTSTRAGHVPGGGRADQSNITLDGVDVNEPLSIYALMPRNTISSGETIIRIPSSLRLIRFQIALETAAIHEDYLVNITTADGRAVTSVNWIEPLTANQTTIDTPDISTSDLPSGDYVLLLMGKEPDGSFVKVAEFSFRLIKY